MAAKPKPTIAQNVVSSPVPPAPIAQAKAASPRVGLPVLYVLPERSPRAGQARPAVITSISDAGAISLRVFLDSRLDVPTDHGQSKHYELTGRTLDLHVVDVRQDPEGSPGSFHVPA